MSDDLVRWLRSAGVPGMDEAANRIEQLEAALEDIAQYVSRADWHYLKDETRKALEEKDDPQTNL